MSLDTQELNELKNRVAQRRASNLSVSSGDGLQLRPWIIGAGVVTCGVALLLWGASKLSGSKPTAAIPQGSPQQDMAMQMLQRQQDINEQLLKGQQELSSQMIQAQSKAKTVQPSINCFLTVVCPSGDQPAQPNQSYAVVGEGVRTAVVDPAKVMPQLQQAQPVQPAQPTQTVQPQLPVQQVVYDPKVEAQMQVIQSWDGQTIAQYAAFCQMNNGGAGITEYDQLTCRALEVMKQQGGL
jgi:hypothetical protein